MNLEIQNRLKEKGDFQDTELENIPWIRRYSIIFIVYDIFFAKNRFLYDS